MAYKPVSDEWLRREQFRHTPLAVFIQDDDEPRASVLHAFGEVSFADRAEFESMVNRAADAGKPVAIDVTECTYMDCSAIGVIVRASKRLGDDLHIVAPRAGRAHRLLELTGLTRVLHVHQTLADARTAIIRSRRWLRSV